MSNNNETSTTALNPSATGQSASSTDQGMMTFVTLEVVRKLIQGEGYRAEIVTDGNISFLRSACNGLDFDVRPGNILVKDPATAPEKPERLADLAFVVLFTVQGNFPSDLLNVWNRTHRFSRLFVDKTIPDREFLVLSLDVSVAGGVTTTYLRHKILIWDSLVRQLVPWLRDELGKIASTVDTQKTAPSDHILPIQPANA